MRIVLLGRNGQLGWELQRSLGILGELIVLNRQGESVMDLERPAQMKQTIRELCPSLIVNAAAFTSVDQAESEVSRAHAINAVAPEALAQVASEIGAWLVHYSSDYVFDGGGSQGWHELDVASPLSVYGRTKLEGERAIMATGCNHLIFRTSWVYSLRRENFAKTMLRIARERECVKVIDDQIGAPTGADLIADVTAHAIRAAMRSPELSGLYHLASSGETSWYGYATYLIDRARQFNPELIWKADKVVPIPTSAFPAIANRPKNSRLNTQKLRATFGLSLPHWQSGIDRLVAEIIK